MRRTIIRNSYFSTLLVALAAAGCSESAVELDDVVLGEETGTRITILLTDAPADYIGAAEVDIGRVELLPADDGPAILLSEDGTDGFVNLLDFQGSATMQLAEADIEPGSFHQLRLIVEAARVQLIEGYTFRDGSTEMDLKVPSGAQTGIKLHLRGEDGEALAITPGETVLVLDFDVSQSFVLRGNPETPAGVHGVNFTPSIRVTGMDVAASISGVVSTEAEGLPIEGLTVRAEPTDEGTAPGYQTTTATAITAEDGSYTMYFLVPGTYDVTVDSDGSFITDPESHTVDLGHSEDATGIDFVLIDQRGSIAGTVTTELEGATVEGLTVTATPDDETVVPVAGVTAADGTYLLEGIIPGTYTVTLEVGEDQLPEPAEHVVEVGASEDVTGVDFAVVEDLTGSISGTVSTALGSVSVEGLTVTATPTEGAPFTATTNAEGVYTIDSLPAGDYTVTVEVGEGLTTDPESVAVELDEDEEVEGVNFAILPAT